MTHTHKATVLALAIIDVITANKDALLLDNVFYGDQNNMPGARNVAVTAANKRITLEGVSGPGGRGMNHLEVLIFVYYSVYNSEEEARLAVDQLAEEIVDLLHQDTTMGGIIIHGFVTDWIPGVAFKATSQYRAVQLNFAGITKTNITP